MSSRSPSTSPPYLGRGGGGDADQPSMERLSLRPLRLRRRHPRLRRPRPGLRPGPYYPEQGTTSSVFIHRPPSPPSPPPPPPSCIGVAGPGLVTQPEPQHVEEWGLALDSPAGINTASAPGNLKPGSPISPPGLPTSSNMNPTDMSKDWHSFSPPPPDASIVDCGVHAALQPHHQEEPESGSELDSPPRITFHPILKKVQEPSSPTSPSGSPPLVDMDLGGMCQDWHSLSPPPLDASIMGRGVHGAPQPQHQEETESGSKLDSPRIAFHPIPKNHEPSSPTSPSGSPTLVDVDPTGPPKYLSDEEDPYFESLVDNFVNATANRCSSALSDDDFDYKALGQRRCVLYAESALKHYNKDEKNEIKYELVSGITSSDIFVKEHYFGHVNFTAKGSQQKEEFFFAELRWDGDTLIPTCVVSLEGIEKVGGLCDSRYDKFYQDVLPIDTQHCYACNRRLKHPKDGKLYEMGHIAMSTYYMS